MYEYDRKGIHGQYQPVVLSCPTPSKGFWNWTSAVLDSSNFLGADRFWSVNPWLFEVECAFGVDSYKNSCQWPPCWWHPYIGDNFVSPKFQMIWAGRFLVLLNSVMTDVMSIEFKNDYFGILSTSVISEKMNFRIFKNEYLVTLDWSLSLW